MNIILKLLIIITRSNTVPKTSLLFFIQKAIVYCYTYGIMATGSNTEGQQFDVAPIESDYYKLLQVEKNASKADIKVAYHKMSRMYHPDKTQDSKTEEMMKRLNEAKSVLLDEVQRAEYDEKHEDGVICDPKGFLPTGRYGIFFQHIIHFILHKVYASQMFF